MKPINRISLYFIFVFGFIVLTFILRTASLSWIHNYRPLGLNPWYLLKGSLRMAFCIAPIQTVIVLPSVLLYSRRQKDKQFLCLFFTTIILCFLDLFIEPIMIWTDYNFAIHLCSIIGFVFIGVIIPFVAILVPRSTKLMTKKKQFS